MVRLKDIPLLLLALGSLLVCPAVGWSVTERCGVVLPLSGPISPVGESIRNSIVMGKAELDTAGQIEFLFEDGKFSPKDTLVAARKLIDLQKVRCLIVFGSSPSLAVVDSAERAGVALLSIAITPTIQVGKSRVFRIYTPVEALAKSIVSEIARRGYKRIALFTSETDGAIAISDYVRANTSAEIVFDSPVTIGETDFRAIIAKLRMNPPDGILLALIPPSLSSAAKQIRQLGITSEIFSGPFLGNDYERKAGEGAFSGAWYSDTALPKSEQFNERYNARFGELPEGSEGVYGYEIVRMLLSALRRGDLLTGLAEVRERDTYVGDYRMVDHALVSDAEIKVVPR